MKCIIFGAGDEFPEKLDLPADDRIITAADGGLKKLNELGISPDFVVGDLDSLERPPESDNFKLLPHIKDTTDTYEAVSIGREHGCTEFHIYGGTGGRLDHTFANIQLAADIAERGEKAYIYGRGYVITAVRNGRITLPARDKGYVSVFAHSDICEGVCIHGLFYELDNAELKNTFALGVSNEFIGKPAEILVASGILCVYYEIR